MNKQTFFHLSIGFLLGVLATILIASNALSTDNDQMLKVLGISDQKNQPPIPIEESFDQDDFEEELDNFE